MESEGTTPIELRQPSWTLLFPGCALVMGLAFAFFGNALGLSGTPAWVRGGMIVGPALLGAVGTAYFLSYRVRANASGITQSSLFHRRGIAWGEVAAFTQGTDTNGSGWNQGETVLTLQNRAGEPLMNLSLSLEPASARERLVERITTHCADSAS